MSDAEHDDCAYCGCDVTVHDPVYVRDGGDDTETPFCNYGCLAAHIDEEGLAVETTCSVEF
ncbi:hypothetical protein ACFQFH_13655 [Halobaculum halobium]|uniref:Metallothionein n=1 Tax=Halobaculum halobium TaxID=3032281 RepID=A0ABD5TBY2_9EURY|nr:hypothetical protein [Halobaculum sp. SYNS20]